MGKLKSKQLNKTQTFDPSIVLNDLGLMCRGLKSIPKGFTKPSLPETVCSVATLMLSTIEHIKVKATEKRTAELHEYNRVKRLERGEK